MTNPRIHQMSRTELENKRAELFNRPAGIGRTMALMAIADEFQERQDAAGEGA